MSDWDLCIDHPENTEIKCSYELEGVRGKV